MKLYIVYFVNHEDETNDFIYTIALSPAHAETNFFRETAENYGLTTDKIGETHEVLDTYEITTATDGNGKQYQITLEEINQ